MFKNVALAAAAAVAFTAVPASAATTVTYRSTNPGGVVTLDPAGPDALSGLLGFNVSGDAGAFSVTFYFDNPFDPAAATSSASFDFDPDVLQFTSGSYGSGGTFTILTDDTGSAITVSKNGLAAGANTLTLNGTFNPTGNGFAAVGGSLNLTAVPEPATWALFILGFGAIGAGMRRRSSQAGKVRASIRFA